MRRLLVLLAALALTLTVAPPADAAVWVTKAQKRLNHLGCNAGPADGDLGQWTRSAVVRFQSREGIEQNGRLDQPTRKRLYAADAPRCNVRPVPAGSGKGRRIVISQRQNWVWLVGRNGKVVSQAGMVDNTGVLGRGSYHVGSYCGRTARIKANRSSGGLLLDNFVRFAPCGIGFHRIPRYPDSGNQIHADWILGTNMSQSHGCIRLSARMSQRVWDFTARSTPVRVV
ncbi:L,D-transpeptidase family protein [Nocardioides caricicola]|uniref:L,D-transpeptidase family protein n=1 Tax=Nocardioides caricicola TaxID=634770 RepID=A0ABW0MY74_9ACTN